MSSAVTVVGISHSMSDLAGSCIVVREAIIFIL